MAGKILVTGARGFVGRALCAHLRRARKRFVGIARSVDGIDPAEREALVAGDLETLDWTPVLSGIDTVVHLAGRAGGDRRSNGDVEASFMTANRDVTRRLAEAAVRAGVRRIVLVSTIKVCGETTRPGEPLGPDAPAHPFDAYARSKLAAEQAFWKALDGASVEGVVLRPPMVYGAGARGHFGQLVAAIERGWPLPIAGVDNRRSVLYVGNAASALEASVDAGELVGRAWPLADREHPSTADLVRRIARALRVRARLFRAPESLLRAAASLAGRPGMAMPLLDSLEVDDAPFRVHAGWSPPYSLDEGIAATVSGFARVRTPAVS